MDWTCRYCWSRRIIVDLSADEPQIVGCLECNWSQIVQEHPDRPMRCVAPTGLNSMGRRGRCSRTADMNGMCRQHSHMHNAWDVVYARFVNAGDDDMPEAYREIFARACVDAGILARFLRDEDRDVAREQELADKVPIARARRSRSTDVKPSVVYFMRRDGLIKIGVTTDVVKRAKAISKGSSMATGMTIGPVEVLATTPGDGAFESRLHRQFAASRVDGEWFRPTPRLLRLIDRYQRRAQATAAA
jgi:hypothetical protein